MAGFKQKEAGSLILLFKFITSGHRVIEFTDDHVLTSYTGGVVGAALSYWRPGGCYKGDGYDI